MSHRIDVSWSGGSVAVLTFSDPARRNQLCWAAVDALAQRLRQCRESGARVVILASGPDGHWFEHAWRGAPPRRRWCLPASLWARSAFTTSVLPAGRTPENGV